MAEYMINESVVNAVKYDCNNQSTIKNFLKGLDYEIITEKHMGGLSKVVIHMPTHNIEVNEGEYLVKESDGNMYTTKSLGNVELL